MISSDYSELLFNQFIKYRKWPGWPDIYELHDGEDQAYFMMLEGLMDEGKLGVAAGPV